MMMSPSRGCNRWQTMRNGAFFRDRNLRRSSNRCRVWSRNSAASVIRSPKPPRPGRTKPREWMWQAFPCPMAHRPRFHSRRSRASPMTIRPVRFPANGRREPQFCAFPVAARWTMWFRPCLCSCCARMAWERGQSRMTRHPAAKLPRSIPRAWR